MLLIQPLPNSFIFFCTALSPQRDGLSGPAHFNGMQNHFARYQSGAARHVGDWCLPFIPGLAAGLHARLACRFLNLARVCPDPAICALHLPQQKELRNSRSEQKHVWGRDTR
eukprot:1686728-Rhodomonas_salina.2